MKLTLAGGKIGPVAAGRNWVAPVALGGVAFIATGGALAVGALLTGPMVHLDVLCSGATLAIAGSVLRALASPADARS